MTASKTLPLVAALLLTGCVSDDDPTSPAPSEPDPHVELSPTEHLLRASMALRGIRPAPGELEQVAADPSTLEGIVDGYLDSSEFGQVIRDMHNEALLSRVDWAFYPAGFPSVGTLEGVDPFVVNGSVQEAALRLIEQVVLSGAPYAEIVTADYVYVSDIVATVWGNLDYPAGGSGWQKAHFTDGRPHAGILSDPWVFTRHQSTISNNNRGRANAISKALLCYDFLSRDIEIDASIDLSDPEVVANAVVDNPTCASCHQTLDPMASFFGDYFPIIVPGSLEGYPYDDYNSLAEGDMSQPFYFPGIFELAGSEPRERAYFGEPGEDVADLGRMIAEDPRFSLCAAKRFYAYFNQRRIDEVALSAVADLQLDFVKKGFDAKALAKAVVLGRDFRRSHATTPTAAEDLVGVRVVQPNQLSSLIADLTGFRWMSQRIVTEDVDLPSVDLVRDSFLGFQILGGGTDSQFVTSPANTFNATSALLLQTLAGEAAAHVVASDFAEPDLDARRLFRVMPEPAGDEAEIREQIAWLHRRIYGELVTPDDEAVSETFELHLALFAEAQNAVRAWEGTVAAMLQDIRVATY